MLNLTGGGLSGGYRKYLQRLVPLLRSTPAISDLTVVVPPGHASVLDEAPDVQTWQPGEAWRGFPALRSAIRRWRPDVVFVPTARWIDCGAPCVSMVRNMEPMAPRLFPGTGAIGAVRIRAMGWVARRAAVRASRVIAVSEFVASHLREQWDIPADRIGVVYHGVDRLPPPDETPGPLASLDRRRPFALVAGSLLPYRGVEDAITALARTDLVPHDLQLVIAGGGTSDYRDRMQGLAASAGVDGRLVWAGELSPRDLAWAYEHCAAFLMTSRVEACPNTALEALAHGALCLSTTCKPMPEFFREAAWYYQAGDAGALGELLRRALSAADSIRTDLTQSARARASAFSWDVTAKRTVAELAKA